MSQTEILLREMSQKMDDILKLMALNYVKETTNEQKKIELLDSVGFEPIEIANFLGKTSDNVRVQLVIIRKKRKNAEMENAKTHSQKTNSPLTPKEKGENKNGPTV